MMWCNKDVKGVAMMIVERERVSWVRFNVPQTHYAHRRSQDFLWGALFLTKSLMTFFCHHLFFDGHMHYQLPPPTFVSHLRGCTSPNSAPFLPHFSKKCLEKIFVTLGGAPAPPAPPGYAHDYGSYWGWVLRVK